MARASQPGKGAGALAEAGGVDGDVLGADLCDRLEGEMGPIEGASRAGNGALIDLRRLYPKIQVEFAKSQNFALSTHTNSIISTFLYNTISL